MLRDCIECGNAEDFGWYMKSNGVVCDKCFADKDYFFCLGCNFVYPQSKFGRPKFEKGLQVKHAICRGCDEKSVSV